MRRQQSVELLSHPKVPTPDAAQALDLKQVLSAGELIQSIQRLRGAERRLAAQRAFLIGEGDQTLEYSRDGLPDWDLK